MLITVPNIVPFSSVNIPTESLPQATEIRIDALEKVPALKSSVSLKDKEITVEEYVKKYFSDIPIMIEIAKCESRFRQFDKSGDVLRGVENNLDRGVMQINEYYHLEDAERLGFDLLTLEGNTAYARMLFEKYNVKPWMSSSKCWMKTVAYSEYRELAMR